MADSVARMRCALESSKLHGEVPDDRAFNDPAEKRQASCLRRQSIQKRVEASTTHDVDPFELPPGKACRITQDLPITIRQTMEDESPQPKGTCFLFRDGWDSLPQ